MGGAGPELNLVNVLLAAVPVAILVVTIIALKWSAPRAGAVSWIVVSVLALAVFGADALILGSASSKGLSFAFFVLSIIWTSVLMYNVIDRLGGIHVIGSTMTRLVEDPLAKALVVGWAFAGLMQGVAGFGLPVAVVTPLLAIMGFRPATAAAIALVGHSWAVTFGSLGSSYYTIQLVSGLEGSDLGPYMAAMFAPATIFTGFAVAHLEGGMKSVRRGAPAILIIGGAMSLALWVTAVLGAYQIASVVASLVGCGVGWAVSRTRLLGRRAEVAVAAADAVTAVPETAPKAVKDAAAPPPKGISFHMAFLPYYLLIAVSIISQIPWVKELGSTWQWGLSYPATETDLGFAVLRQNNYAAIKYLSHPAPLILISLALTYLVFRIRGQWKPGTIKVASTKTYSQCVSTSVGVSMMVMMALVMIDTGMTALLGEAIARTTGQVFPIFSPFIGVLGTFMTGSNTNSNVMFGALQLETGATLGITAVLIASIQSIGGSFGSSIAPAKVMVATAIVGLNGKENEVLMRTIPYCIVTVLLVGLQAWLMVTFFSG
ncbi:MAG: L-lactate permease [SAR202 cluster bacterium]|nr:L-lactate permease [SAR202 cluster bacterium]